MIPQWKKNTVTQIICLVEAEAEEAWEYLEKTSTSLLPESLWINRRIIASLEWLLQEASPASLIAMRDLMEEKLSEQREDDLLYTRHKQLEVAKDIDHFFTGHWPSNEKEQ